MCNPLVEAVNEEMARLGIHDAKLVDESYEPSDFGNAVAVYELGNLRLRFVRDRGRDTIDFVLPGSSGDYYIFSDLATVMGWETLEELVKKYKSANANAPPAGPISLNRAIRYIQQDLDRLQQMFLASEIATTRVKLRNAERQRMEAMFG